MIVILPHFIYFSAVHVSDRIRRQRLCHHWLSQQIIIRCRYLQVFKVVKNKRQWSGKKRLFDQKDCRYQHWQRQTSIRKKCKHIHFAIEDKSLASSRKLHNSWIVDFPYDLAMYQLLNSFLIPLIESLSKFSSSPNKDSSKITDDCVGFATSSHESSDRHHASISV